MIEPALSTRGNLLEKSVKHIKTKSKDKKSDELRPEYDLATLLRIEVPFKDPMEDAVKVAIKAGGAGTKTKRIAAK